MFFIAASLIAAFVTTVAVLGNLEEVIEWIKRGIAAVKKIVGRIVAGVKVFVRKIGEAIKEISKNYSQDELGRWHEKTVERIIPEEMVPIEFRQRAVVQRDADVSDILELKLA